MSKSKIVWGGGAVVMALLVVAVKLYSPSMQHPMELLLCESTYTVPSASGKPTRHYDKCASEPLGLPSPDECERARLAVTWALVSGLKMKPQPWVTHDSLVVACVTKKKLKNLGSTSPKEES